MVTFRSNNNNRRPPFRNNNNRRPQFRRSEEGPKFSNNNSFKRNVPGRNNHNAAKLVEKYNEMAREALANEDRVLSENYFQHADHFTRIINEQESFKKARSVENEDKVNNIDKSFVELSAKADDVPKNRIVKDVKDVKENPSINEKLIKKQPEAS